MKLSQLCPVRLYRISTSRRLFLFVLLPCAGRSGPFSSAQAAAMPLISSVTEASAVSACHSRTTDPFAYICS